MKNQPLWRRFGFALQGLQESWKSEKSFRAHVVVCAGVLALLLATRPAPVWWALILLTCALLLGIELVNTAVEKLADHLHPAQHEAIRIVKDALAGAVLVLCVAGGLVGIAFLYSLR